MSDLDLTFVDGAVKRIGTEKEKVFEILQAVRGEFGRQCMGIHGCLIVMGINMLIM